MSGKFEGSSTHGYTHISIFYNLTQSHTRFMNIHIASSVLRPRTSSHVPRKRKHRERTECNATHVSEYLVRKR